MAMFLFVKYFSVDIKWQVLCHNVVVSCGRIYTVAELVLYNSS